MRKPTPDKKPKREEPYDFGQARYASIDFLPYLYSHVASLIPVQRPGLGTIAVDQHMRVYYDPAVFDEWTIGEATGVILHEDLHVLLHHHQRAKEYLGEDFSAQAWEDWNTAADLVINQTLEGVKDSKGRPLPLPKEGTFLKDYEGFEPNLSVEEYYELLAERQKPPKSSGGPPGEDGDEEGSGGSGKGSSEASGAGDGQDDPEDQEGPGDNLPGRPAHDPEPGDDSGGRGGSDGDEQDQQPQLGGGDPADGPDDFPVPSGGSGADGRQRPWELPPPEECDIPGMDPYNQQMLQQDAAQKLDEWQSKNRGTAPGYLGRFADEILRPKVDPFKALHAAVRASIIQKRGQGNYTYRERFLGRVERLTCCRTARPAIRWFSDVSHAPRVPGTISRLSAVSRRFARVGGGDLGSEPQPACARRSISPTHVTAFCQVQRGAAPPRLEDEAQMRAVGRTSAL